MSSLPGNQFYGKLRVPIEQFNLTPLSSDDTEVAERVKSMNKDVQIDLDSNEYFVETPPVKGYVARMTCNEKGELAKESFDLNMYVPFKVPEDFSAVLALRGPDGLALQDYVLRGTIGRGVLGGRVVYHTAYIIGGRGCTLCHIRNRACFRILKSPGEWSPCVGCAASNQKCDDAFSLCDIDAVEGGQRWFFGTGNIPDDIPHDVEADFRIPRECDQSTNDELCGPRHFFETATFSQWQSLRGCKERTLAVMTPFLQRYPTQGPRVTDEDEVSANIIEKGPTEQTEENHSGNSGRAEANDDDEAEAVAMPRCVHMSALAVTEGLYEKVLARANSAEPLRIMSLPTTADKVPSIDASLAAKKKRLSIYQQEEKKLKLSSRKATEKRKRCENELERLVKRKKPFKAGP